MCLKIMESVYKITNSAMIINFNTFSRILKRINEKNGVNF